MLSHHERRQLERIETMTSIEDPEFADGLRTGFPRRPQEYRRWPSALLVSLGALCVLVAVISGSWLPAILSAVILPAAGLAWPSRRLDRPRHHGVRPWRRHGRPD